MARSGMTDLITRLRGLAGDDWQRKQDTATGDGSTKVYWLTHNPQASGGTVSSGGTVQTLTTHYTWDVTDGRVEYVTAPASSVAIAVEYRHAQFTDAQLQDILDSNVTLLADAPLTWHPDTIGGGTIAYYNAGIPYRDLEAAASGTARWIVRDSIGGQIGTANYTPDYITGVLTFTADQAGSAYYLTGRSYDLYGAAADVWLRRQVLYSDWYQVESDGQRLMRQQAFEHAGKMAATMRQRSGQNRQRGDVSVGQFWRTDLAGSD